MNHKYDIDWLMAWILAERLQMLGVICSSVTVDGGDVCRNVGKSMELSYPDS